jgi:hypothetical protein
MIKEYWIDWVQLLLIALLAPLFLFPEMKYVVVFFIVPAIWIWRWLNKKNILERTSLDWPLF